MFKKGDKVECIRDSDYNTKVGEKGLVMDDEREGCGCSIKADKGTTNAGMTLYYSKSELEYFKLIDDSSPKFSVGDEVEILELNLQEHLYRAVTNEVKINIGSDGKIVGIDKGSKRAKVRTKNNCWWYRFKDLKLVNKKDSQETVSESKTENLTTKENKIMNKNIVKLFKTNAESADLVNRKLAGSFDTAQWEIIGMLLKGKEKELLELAESKKTDAEKDSE